jgi:hypothetical protein
VSHTAGLRFLVHQRKWHPELTGRGIRGSRWKYPDDGIAGAVEIDVAAEDLPIFPKVSLPCIFTEHDDMVSVRGFILFHERSAEKRCDPKKRE